MAGLVDPLKRTRVKKTQNQSLMAYDTNTISWNSQIEDQEGLWSPGASTRFYAMPGTNVWHAVSLKLFFSGPSGATIKLRVFKNGSAMTNRAVVYNVDELSGEYSDAFQLTQGDYIEFDLYTTSSNVSILTDSQALEYGPM